MELNEFKIIPNIGKIPQNWEVKKAEELSLKISKGTTPPKTEISDKGNIPFLRVNNLTFNGVLDKTSDFIYVSEDSHNRFLSRSKVYPNDVLMNIVGPPLGKTTLLDASYQEYNMNQAIVFYRLNSSVVDANYFLAFLNSSIAQNWFQSQSKKTSGQQNLTIEICKRIMVPVPPVEEQKKIAKILSVWDKAITTTEQLLANSQQQKKALMQKLLTGKVRFAVFNEKWTSGHLCDIAKIGKGIALSSKDLKSGNFPVVAGGKSSPYSHAEYTHENVITVSASGAYAGYVAYYGYKIWASDCSVVEADINSDIKFIYQLMILNQQKIYSLQSGGAQPHIYPRDLNSIKIEYPTKEEQKKISSVLSILDDDVETLQKKLNCLKQEKKALMQQLLTGKRRVKIEGAA